MSNIICIRHGELECMDYRHGFFEYFCKTLGVVIIFSVQHQKKTERKWLARCFYRTLIPHPNTVATLLCEIRSRSLAVYNNEFILVSASTVDSEMIDW